MADLTELRNGPIVQTAAIRLTVDLEHCGHVLSVKEGQLLVSHGSALTPQDREQIRALKAHLMEIAAYHPPEPR